jgi:multiple sugar transport system permease protein
MWLLPLIAVMLFSIRPLADFSAGNYWGVPSSFRAVRQLRPRVLRQ